MAEAAAAQAQEAPPQEAPKVQPGEEDVTSWVRAGKPKRDVIEGHSEGQAATEEEKPAAEAKEEPKDKPEEEKQKERLDKGFAALKQQRKQLAIKERTIQGREIALSQAQQKLAEERELLKSDPYEFMRRHNMSARDIAKRAVDEAKTPEQEAVFAEKAALTAKLEKMEQELTELREHRQQTLAQTEKQQSIGIIQSAIKESADDYPLLSEEQPEEVLAALEHVYEEQYKPAGLRLTPESLRDILQGFESNLRTKAEELAARLARRKPGGTQVPSERGNGAVQSANPEAVTAPDISTRDAGTRAAPPRPLTAAERTARAISAIRFID